jgi:hypothetical protein
MSDIRVLYSNLLRREYWLSESKTPIIKKWTEDIFAFINNQAGNLEDKIKAHLDRPKTPEAELLLKQEIIQDNMNELKGNQGLCYRCEHYLPMQEARETAKQDENLAMEQMARITNRLDTKGIVCDKTKLPAHEAPLLICTYFQESSDVLQQLASGNPQNDFEMWSALERKYGKPQRQTNSPKQRF